MPHTRVCSDRRVEETWLTQLFIFRPWGIAFPPNKRRVQAATRGNRYPVYWVLVHYIPGILMPGSTGRVLAYPRFPSKVAPPYPAICLVLNVILHQLLNAPGHPYLLISELTRQLSAYPQHLQSSPPADRPLSSFQILPVRNRGVRYCGSSRPPRSARARPRRARARRGRSIRRPRATAASTATEDSKSGIPTRNASDISRP